MRDICIIGGGASGLAAAVSSAKIAPDMDICILEKKDAPGKKLAATGNGKCNLTNESCEGAVQILDFFRELGVYTRTDREGRVYPYSQQAKDVVYALVREAERMGVEILTDSPAAEIRRIKEGFQVQYPGGQLKTRKLLLASGGKAGPQFGTAGDGYAMAKKLGHTICRLSPVLTGMEISEDVSRLKGIRVKARTFLEKDGKITAEETGEVQFNEDGISGICIMNLSRFVKLEQGESFSRGIARYQAGLDFLPELNLQETVWLLASRRTQKGWTAEDLLQSILPARLGETILSESGFSLKQPVDSVTQDDLQKLARLLKGWKLHLKGTKGWKTAQCTAGGIAMREICQETMESRLIPGLYFSGEILDYDGPCGGYNLQNAWETGIKAGKAMANAISYTSD